MYYDKTITDQYSFRTFHIYRFNDFVHMHQLDQQIGSSFSLNFALWACKSNRQYLLIRFLCASFFVFFISGTIYNILYQKNKDQKSGLCRLLMFSTLITDAFVLLTVAAIFIADYFVIFNDIGAILSPIIYSIISIVESLIAMFIYYVKYS